MDNENDNISGADLVAQLKRRALFGLQPQMSPIPEVPPPSAMDQYMSAVKGAPKMENYHPSKFRNIMAYLGAGLTGASQGGEAGARSGDIIRNSPFYRQQNRYQHDVLGPASQAAGLEEERAKQHLAEVLGTAKVGAEEAKGEAEKARAHNFNYRSSPQYVKDQEEINAVAPTIHATASRDVADTNAKSREATAKINAEARTSAEEIRAKNAKELEGTREAGRNSRFNVHEKNANAREGQKEGAAMERTKYRVDHPSVKRPSMDRSKAEKLAGIHLREKFPEAKDFIDEKGNFLPEVQKHGPFNLLGGVDQTKHKKYQSYLSLRNKISEELVGGGSGAAPPEVPEVPEVEEDGEE